MNLDFLEVLSQPLTRVEGHCGTQGTTSVHAGRSVPPIVPLSGTTRDNLSGGDANAGLCPAVSPSCPAPQETSKALFHGPVPAVPLCPPQNERVLISRWLRNRCARSRQAWGSEKSLWRDYCVWCEQHKQPACPCEVFYATMNESFTREEDGWQGIMLAIDFRDTKYVM